MKNADLKEDTLELYLVKILIQNKYRIYRHLIGVVFLFLMFISLQSIEEYNIYRLGISLLIILGVFYTNIYVLLPALLYRKKYFKYLVSVVLLLLTSLVVSEIIDVFFVDPDAPQPQLSFLFIFLAYTVLLSPFIFVSTGIKIFQKWIKYDNRMKELEKNTVEMELKALRNQINPHFIFNTLNNLNYMIMKDQEKASVILSKLSGFLSHHLHENHQKYISLASEIRFIHDHLDLESIRRDYFTFEVTPPKETDIEIPTNIFSVFVENAIKHSLDPDVASYVRVSFEKTGDMLVFNCINTKSSNLPVKNHKGVGLKNVKRRLELIYLDHYTLKTTNSEHIYSVELTFPV
ncbi:sensor histidine kinase [Sinomicrobium soli]|uniref:sensor histidine kinase n=1 Tax=Sinomicrobium sp. N-1-3-6 TaxID=2219864 RepID=UPI000DCDE2E5|nr:histidine kinase [Sinomicrobium sp. N-1-3-6]RAV30316.1 hypothetical protein DN748_02045 [Sinomicrobium sp. N-1-3-6]